MKGDIVLKILGALGRATLGVAELFDVFLRAGYGTSIREFEHEAKRKDGERRRKEEIARFKHNYHAFLSRLKRDGLIGARHFKGNKFFFLTPLGRRKLKALKRVYGEGFPRISPAEKGDTFVIITFDVPEKEKRKRNWLRLALRHMGFRMVQKSVWIGKVKLPKRFLDSLYNLRLVEYVEIFEIGKMGSLRHIA